VGFSPISPVNNRIAVIPLQGKVFTCVFYMEDFAKGKIILLNSVI
jgi:hypothetical protein